MNPIKVKFAYEFVSNDMDYKKYTGINKINSVIEQSCRDTRGRDYLNYFSKENLPAYQKDIENCFLEDVKKSFSFQIAQVKFQLAGLEYGRTPIPGTGEAYKYDCITTVTSEIYICIQLYDHRLAVCYSEEDRELKFIPTNGLKIIVQ